ncbi:MAG: hypothetical protein HYW86_00685 [Candidatus Roizmanbacteria bacterium]|nr:MAG: hypothetical protein HYW86_00685 [Candidatus Roizmanbacteria bacterium]
MKLKKINNITAILWALACLFFAFIIVYTTKGMTHDPNFSGGPETPWLFPMLSTIGIGAISFGLMVLTWLVILIKKDKSEYKPPLGLSTKKAVFSVVLLGLIGLVFLIGYRNANSGYKKANYTGQQLFDSMNEYRLANGKLELKLDPYICDNLVARYLKVKSGDVGHEGFEEWVKNEEIDKKFAPIAELYIKDTYTTKDAIDFWSGSPGHRLSLLGDFSVGCAYANEGVGVAVLGNPIQANK